MFVEASTWEKLREGATEVKLADERVRLPPPEYLVALKLHAALRRIFSEGRFAGVLGGYKIRCPSIVTGREYTNSRPVLRN